MFLYQLLNRIFETRGKLTFPAAIDVSFHLEPKAMFWDGQGKTFTYPPGALAQVSLEMRTGRVMDELVEPVTPAQGSFECLGFSCILNGSVLRIQGQSPSRGQFVGLLSAILHGLPARLNIEFIDVPRITAIEGNVGGVEFRWIPADYMRYSQEIIDESEHEPRMQRAFSRIRYAPRTYRRLNAAVEYYYVACRLEESGLTLWEFTSEVLLNLAKVLLTLYPSDKPRDACRAALKDLGYSESEIEDQFIPILLLRDDFNAAHPFLTFVKQDVVSTLHLYSSDALRSVRDLLCKLFEAAESGAYTELAEERGLSTRESKTIERIKNYLLQKHPNYLEELLPNNSFQDLQFMSDETGEMVSRPLPSEIPNA
jgi:hypothetical protein